MPRSLACQETQAHHVEVRLVSWNCNDGFASKYHRLEELDFDVAVVNECRPVELSPSGRALTYFTQQAGRGAARSIGVFARAPWRVERLEIESARDMLWVLPARVSGPIDFVLLAVHTYRGDGTGSYQAQVARIISEVLPHLDSPVVLAGDLNAPYPSAAEDSSHAANLEGLRDHGLVGAFEVTHEAHVLFETVRTYFHHRKLDSRPLQIDHVFVPTTWAGSLEYSARGYDEWVAHGPSDHVPVVVDVHDPDSA